MLLLEALSNANDEDTIINKSFFSEFKSTKKDFCELSGMTGAVAISSDWQIIPAKKEVMTFEEWSIQQFVTNKSHNMPPYDFGEMSWNASAENTHLLYADLMKLLDPFNGSNESIMASVVANIEELRTHIDKINAASATSSD